MSRKLKLSKEFQQEDFYKYAQSENRAYAKKRLLAMHYLQQELSTQEIAHKVGCSRQTIWEWFQRYEKDGLARLQSGPLNRGRKKKLSLSQEASLKSEIIHLQSVHSGKRLTSEEIRQHIENLWGVEVAPGSMYRILKRLGIVCITHHAGALRTEL